MRRRMASTLLVLCVVGLGLVTSGAAAPASAGTAATLEVGTSPLCLYHTIEDAIAAADPGDTIKVENILFNEQPLVVAKNLTLAGGYNSAHPYGCLTLTGYNWTTVRRTGTSSAPILHVQNAAVEVTWFTFEANSSGGGVVVTDGTLTLENVIIQDNAKNLGGGLYMTHSTANLVDTEILNNSATEGGGIYADDHSSVVADGSTIQDNSGTYRGAGVYLSGASTLEAVDGTGIVHNRTVMGCDEGGGIYASGPGTEVLVDASMIISNTALLRGGGLYLGDQAVATIRGGSWLSENGAYGPSGSGGGGGVYVTGTGSTLNVSTSIFHLNWADPDGGAIWNDSGTLDLENAVFLSNNVAQSGGAVYTSHGPASIVDGIFLSNRATYSDGGGIATYRSELSVHRGYFAGNSADGEGSAIFVQGANGPSEPAAEIVNCYLVDNPTTAKGVEGPPAAGSTLYVEGTSATITHNTLAHSVQQASFGVYVGNDSTLAMTNNILSGFYTAIRRLSGGTGTATSSYDLFYNNTVNWDTTGVVVDHAVFGDPAFVSMTNYHLTSASAAINAGADAGVTIDYDDDSRPWAGGYDIGADEYPERRKAFLPVVTRDH